MKLKEKDYTILVELIKNSRIPNNQLAKFVRVSNDTLLSRISYFEEAQLIKGYSLNIDYSLLGYFYCDLFIKLYSIEEEKLKSLIFYLEKHFATTWIGKSLGVYDLKVSILVKKLDDITQFETQLYENFKNIIKKIDSLVLIDKYKASPQKFIENLLEKKINFPKQEKKSKEIQKIDLKDKELLYYLGQNSRRTMVDLSQKINLSPEITTYRYKKLISTNVIKGFSCVLDGKKFQRVWAVLLLNVVPHKFLEFEEFLKRSTIVSSYAKTQGSWNLTITLFSKNIDDLYKGISDLRINFAEKILEQELLYLIDIYKYPMVPEIILK